MPDERSTSCLGLFDKKPRWGLSRSGWIVLLSAALLAIALLLFVIHPFLAVTRPVNANLLVVEGWVSPAAVRAAAEEVRKSRYEYVLATGGPIKSIDESEFPYRTYAEQAYQRLKRAGVSTNNLFEIAAPDTDRNRTFVSAVAVRQWLHANRIEPERLNLLTSSVHARRSRLLFQKAFGPGVKVGVIAAPPDEYPANRWWKYSAGVKDVISESAGYLYARFFFWPG